MKSDNPLVSILLNCYNAEKFISKAVESVLSQTYVNWELIIWDDGSTEANKVVSPTLPTNNYFLTVFDPNCLNPYQVEAIVRVTYVKNEIESNASTVQGSNPIIKIGDEINNELSIKSKLRVLTPERLRNPARQFCLCRK